MKHLAALGMGYVAKTLAGQLASESWTVTGGSRSNEGAASIRTAGYQALIWNDATTDADIVAGLADATHLLLSAAPTADGDPIAQRLRPLIRELTRLKWVGYISSISVYGDQGSAWVTEATPLNPDSERARRRVQAETEWQELANLCDAKVCIFRLPGIYGPGRSAFDRLRSGTAQRIIKPGQVFNRMHVEDIAGVVYSAIAKDGDAASVYNLADDLPAPPQDVIAYAAELMGIEPPPEIPFDEAELSPMAKSFYGANKRIRNTLLKENLGYKLRYPTYREGLRAILKAGG